MRSCPLNWTSNHLGYSCRFPFRNSCVVFCLQSKYHAYAIVGARFVGGNPSGLLLYYTEVQLDHLHCRMKIVYKFPSRKRWSGRLYLTTEFNFKKMQSNKDDQEIIFHLLRPRSADVEPRTSNQFVMWRSRFVMWKSDSQVDEGCSSWFLLKSWNLL